MSKSKLIQQNIEEVREHAGRPQLIALLCSEDTTKFITATGANGAAVDLAPYCHDGHLTMNVSYEAVGRGGMIEYFDEGMSFLSRISGQAVTVYYPYECLVALTFKNEQNQDCSLDLGAALTSTPTVMPVWVYMEIVKYMAKTYPNIPVFVTIAGEDQVLEHTQIHERDLGTLCFGLKFPGESAFRSYRYGCDTDDSMTMTEELHSGEVRTVVMVNIFVPGPDVKFMNTPMGFVAADEGLMRHLTAETLRRNPEVIVDADEQAANPAALTLAEHTEGAAESAPKQINVGDTTEVSSGNVTAVDFRNRKVLK